MAVTVKLAPEVAEQLRAGEGTVSSGSDSSRALAIQREAGRLGVTLTPLHPNVDDPELSTYFLAERVEAPADAGANPAGDSSVSFGDVATALQNLDGVEAAYAAPMPEPAGP